MSCRTLIVGSLLLTVSVFDAANAQSPTTQPQTASQPAAAEDDAPARRGLVAFDEMTFDLSFESTFDERRIRFETRERFATRFRQIDRAYSFEESLGMRATGSLIDERVLQFDVATRFGFSQERFTERRPGPDLQQDPHGNLFEYDIHAVFLPQGKITTTAWASRLDSRLPRAFQPSLDRTQEKYGVSVQFNDRVLPMRFSFEHTWDALTSRTRDLLDDEQRGRDTFEYEATWHISERQSLRLEYEHDDRREQYSGSDFRFDTIRDYIVLNHQLRFGPEARSFFETLARFQDERGDLARDIFELSSRLRLQHTKALASHYHIQYLRDSFQDLETDTWRAEAGLTHTFDEWLTTSLDVYALKQNAEWNADFVEWGGIGNLSFNRENPWGRLSGHVAYHHTSVDTNDNGRSGIVIGESVTLRDPLPAYLVHTDVELSSIVVTDASRTRTYLLGRDYVVLQVGRYTGLRRIPAGEIPDRATVFVNYTYRAASDYDLRRDRIDFRLQQAFKMGLTPYYAGSIQNEDLDRDDFLRFRARNVNRHRLGATYRQRLWSVGCEYEYNDDAIDPYQAVHFNGDVVLWQNARNQLDARGNFSRFWFDGSDGLEPRNVNALDVGLGYRHLLARYLEVNASGMYRYEDDTLFGDTHGVDLTAGVEWRLGYFSLLLEAEYDLLDLPDSSEDGFAVWLKLKREIPVIARRDG